MKVKACLFLFLVMLAVIAIPKLKASPEKPKIYVNPELNEFSTITTSVGDEFTISVMAADWSEPGVFSYQFKLTFDNTMVEAVAAEIPQDHWLTPTDPTKIFTVDAGTTNNEEGFVSFGVTLLSPEAGKTGSGTIATITLRITTAPATGQNISSSLELKDLILVNPEANQIPSEQYEVINGTYLFSSIAAPNTPPVASNLSITPSSPKTTDDLVGNYDYYDADGDDESGSEIKWYKDDLLQTAYNDSLTVPSSATSDDEEWYFTVKPSDGEDFGTLMTSPTVTIGAPPGKREDLNGDGKVNIQDIAIWGQAFGSNPEHPRWNAMADINEDGKVDMIDGVLIAKEFNI